jgi:hypothetical protein
MLQEPGPLLFALVALVCVVALLVMAMQGIGGPRGCSPFSGSSIR